VSLVSCEHLEVKKKRRSWRGLDDFERERFRFLEGIKL
jgi:hypothetical protein